jgi:hypothetical protein
MHINQKNPENPGNPEFTPLYDVFLPLRFLGASYARLEGPKKLL